MALDVTLHGAQTSTLLTDITFRHYIGIVYWSDGPPIGAQVRRSLHDGFVSCLSS